MNELREVLETMDYTYLIAYAELVFGVKDPESYKHEDLINEMLVNA